MTPSFDSYLDQPTTARTPGDPVTGPNYIDVHHEYYSAPDEDGIRLRSVDVWHATRPAASQYELVDNDDKPVEGHQATVTVGWTIARTGGSEFAIHDQDDIDGLRKLLDKLEAEFKSADEEKDRLAMAKLLGEFEEENPDGTL